MSNACSRKCLKGASEFPTAASTLICFSNSKSMRARSQSVSGQDLPLPSHWFTHSFTIVDMEGGAVKKFSKWTRYECVWICFGTMQIIMPLLWRWFPGFLSYLRQWFYYKNSAFFKKSLLLTQVVRKYSRLKFVSDHVILPLGWKALECTKHTVLRSHNLLNEYLSTFCCSYVLNVISAINIQYFVVQKLILLPVSGNLLTGICLCKDHRTYWVNSWYHHL